ncbi:MAG: membrane protein insertion efficiency factor YidD [Gammaproteobacteria bacterium]|nr:membrane protein insertion efficiency factor YidD [Gammaproteobacteria bacterium]MCZ6883133.1 membrane protein insertion efficiency factor YidD [Gammaproteobacteria bacterium]
MRKLLIIPIRIYRYLLSPLMASSCRYTPSCSEYAIEAIQQHGVVKGLMLATKRISSCHPWHAGGYDPVPDARLAQHKNLNSAQSRLDG